MLHASLRRRASIIEAQDRRDDEPVDKLNTVPSAMMGRRLTKWSFCAVLGLFDASCIGTASSVRAASPNDD
jgi:hypothetical protein